MPNLLFTLPNPEGTPIFKLGDRIFLGHPPPLHPPSECLVFELLFRHFVSGGLSFKVGRTKGVFDPNVYADGPMPAAGDKPHPGMHLAKTQTKVL